MALPLQTLLQTPQCFTMTIKIQVSSRYQKQYSSTYPVNVYHTGFLHLSPLFQYLELISSQLYKKVNKLTLSCPFWASSRALSLITLSSSSFHFRTSSSSTFWASSSFA